MRFQDSGLPAAHRAPPPSSLLFKKIVVVGDGCKSIGYWLMVLFAVWCWSKKVAVVLERSISAQPKRQVVMLATTEFYKIR